MYVAQKNTQLVWRQASKALAPRGPGELGANPSLKNPRPNPGHWAASQLVIKALTHAPCCATACPKSFAPASGVCSCSEEAVRTSSRGKS